MPGMMDTVLNLGLNDEVVKGLAEKAGARFAYDSYRRFLDMFGNVVMGVPREAFEHELEAMKVPLSSTLPLTNVLGSIGRQGVHRCPKAALPLLSKRSNERCLGDVKAPGHAKSPPFPYIF